jgi:uncharacterized protein
MTLPITSLFAGLLAVLMIILAAMVISLRAQTGIAILHGDNMKLAVAMRRFGNFTEYVPFALALLLIMELQAASSTWLYACGGLLLAGRLLHPFGLSATNAKDPLRIAGGTLTIISILVAAVFLLWTRFA